MTKSDIEKIYSRMETGDTWWAYIKREGIELWELEVVPYYGRKELKRPHQSQIYIVADFELYGVHKSKVGAYVAFKKAEEFYMEKEVAKRRNDIDTAKALYFNEVTE